MPVYIGATAICGANSINNTGQIILVCLHNARLKSSHSSLELCSSGYDVGCFTCLKLPYIYDDRCGGCVKSGGDGLQRCNDVACHNYCIYSNFRMSAMSALAVYGYFKFLSCRIHRTVLENHSPGFIVRVYMQGYNFIDLGILHASCFN